MKKKIVGFLGTIVTAVAGIAITAKILRNQIADKNETVDKFKGYYLMLNQWLQLKQENKSIEEYFLKNGYETIAIYGMGEMGTRFYDELKNSNQVKIKYAVDKNADFVLSELEVLALDGDLPKVDAIVVTATYAFPDIKKELQGCFDGEIISLEDVLYEI